jgi:general secretion pathway protein K
VDGGSLEGYVEDLQGRFNLNNLAQGGDEGKLAQEQFKRLLITLDLNEGLANTIQDWIDADLETRFPDGAEDTYYLGLEPAYRTANRLMTSPSELLLLKEVSLEDYETLRPHVSALPTTTPININSATAEVLTSIIEGLSLVQMQSIVDAREKDPFEDVDELLSNTLFAGKEIPDTMLSVSTNYFILRSEAKIGHLQQKMNVVYERDAEGRIYSLMRAQGDI